MNSPRAKACNRCGTVKPIEAYAWLQRDRGKRAATCRTCENKTAREWRRQNPELVKAKTHAARSTTYADPIAYSRHICEHIAKFTNRSITRFETNTGKEAPPHLTAIRDLAETLVGQLPQDDTLPRVYQNCAHCESRFELKQAWAKYCSKRCRERARQLRRRIGNQPPKPCAFCSKLFVPDRRTGLYCTKRCQQRADYIRNYAGNPERRRRNNESRRKRRAMTSDPSR